jgi:hypothetical protein
MECLSLNKFNLIFKEYSMKTISFKKLLLTSAASLAFLITAPSHSYASSLSEDVSVDESQEGVSGLFFKRAKAVKKGEALITRDNVSDFISSIQKIKSRGSTFKLKFNGESEGDYNFETIATCFAELWATSLLSEREGQEAITTLTTFKMRETDEALSFEDLQIEGYFPSSSKQKSPAGTRALFLFDQILINAFKQKLKDGIWDQEATATIFEKAINTRAAKERAKKGSVLPPVPESSESVHRRKSSQLPSAPQRDSEEQDIALQEARKGLADIQKLHEASELEKTRLSKLVKERELQLETLEKSKQDLTHTLEETTEQLQKETAKVQQLEETIAKQKNTLKQRGSDLQISQKQVSALEAEKEKLKKALATLEGELSQAQQTSSKLQEEADSRDEKRQNIQSLKATVKQQKKQLTTLQQKLEAAEIAKNEILREKEQLTKSIDEAEQELEKNRALLKEKQAKLEAATASVERLTESSAKLENELAGVKEELEEISQQNKRFQQYDHERTNELSDLKIEMVKTKRQIRTLKTKHSQLKEEAEKLRKEKQLWLAEKAKIEKEQQKAKKLK